MRSFSKILSIFDGVPKNDLIYFIFTLSHKNDFVKIIPKGCTDIFTIFIFFESFIFFQGSFLYSWNMFSQIFTYFHRHFRIKFFCHLPLSMSFVVVYLTVCVRVFNLTHTMANLLLLLAIIISIIVH